MLFVTAGSPFVLGELIVAHLAWIVNCFVVKIGHFLFILSVFVVDVRCGLCYNVNEMGVLLQLCAILSKRTVGRCF